MNRNRPTFHRRSRPSWRRQVTALVGVIGLLSGMVLPLAQSVATSSEAGTLLAAICSPNGVRYVEIDLGDAGPDDPRPLLGAIDHCPGCLGGSAPAVLLAAGTVAPPSGGGSCVSAFADLKFTQRTETCFHSRAPPPAS